VSPRELARLAQLPSRYARALQRFRYGPGPFKVDWALDGPIPWTAAPCTRTATVHVGATLDDISESERNHRCPRPFVLLAQPSLFDETRTPVGKHTAWAYCRVPHGSTGGRADAIEGQVERFAPGFRELILARSAHGPAEFEADNRNCVGGDINGGVLDLRQLWVRPGWRAIPYPT